MDSRKTGFHSIDEYIASFPGEIQAKLEALRATIRAAAPDAVERISYQMPAFTQEGNLVYFAATRNHIALHPTSSGVAAFEDELSPYDHAKGTIRFPLNQPLPMDLIARIVQFRVQENLARAATKAAKARKKKAANE